LSTIRLRDSLRFRRCLAVNDQQKGDRGRHWHDTVLIEAATGHIAVATDRYATGTLQFSGYESWRTDQPCLTLSVPPGTYGRLVHACNGRDLAALQAAEVRLVGEPAIAHRKTAGNLWFLGCLPTCALVVTLLWSPLRTLLPAVFFGAALSWLPYIVVVRGSRYRATDERLRTFRLSSPQYIIQLTPIESARGLSGGFVMNS